MAGIPIQKILDKSLSREEYMRRFHPEKVIKKGDIVRHTLSGLYFKCENQKMEKWMNESEYYEKSTLPAGYIL